jgi:alpha-L-fucosidase 2
VLPSRSTTHGFNNALADTFAGGMWVGGAGWAAHFFYDYYLYTGDRDFLAKHALPFMEKAAVFFEDYLYEGPDGKLVFSPCQSPENTPGNSDSQASFNATMDVAVARELLRNAVAASRELGCNADRIPRWEAMLAKMPDYMVETNGTLKEWLTPLLTNNDDHRHASQLYPLFDGIPEEIAQSPALREAFRKSIEYKLNKHWQNNQRGFMSFGLVQLGQAATSLGESELAYHCLRHLVNRFWLNNLASMHNHRSLFNMDISGGMPAVIIKMLVASSPGRIDLLPSLPPAWPAGAIEGVLCRGGVEMRRLEWRPGRVVVTLFSRREQQVELRVAGSSTRLSLPAGKPVTTEIDR